VSERTRYIPAAVRIKAPPGCAEERLVVDVLAEEVRISVQARYDGESWGPRCNTLVASMDEARALRDALNEALDGKPNAEAQAAARTRLGDEEKREG